MCYLINCQQSFTHQHSNDTVCFVPSSFTRARFLCPSLPSLHKVVIVAFQFRQAHALLVKLSLSFFNFLLLAHLLYGDFTSSYKFTASVRRDISLETAEN